MAFDEELVQAVYWDTPERMQPVIQLLLPTSLDKTGPTQQDKQYFSMLVLRIRGNVLETAKA